MSRLLNLFHYIVIISIAHLVRPLYGYPQYEPKQVTYDHINNNNRFARLIGGNTVICEVATMLVDLSQDGYDIYPTELINKTCDSNTKELLMYPWNGSIKSEICFHDDNIFGCETMYDDVQVFKRKIAPGRKECWERHVYPVGVGCKCKVSVRNYY